MRFFNICYECNDARDDHSKLLKQQNATDGVFPHWFRADDNDNFDGDDFDDGGDVAVHEWTLQKLNLKSYHLHSGMQLFKKSVNRLWLKGIKHLLHIQKEKWQRPKSK